MLAQPIGLLLILTCITTCMAFASPLNDGIAVVGCGVLGTSLCKQLLASPDFEGRSVTGITKSTNRHNDIRQQVGNTDRFTIATSDQIQGKKFKDVVFCAPPSGSDDYPGAVKDAVCNLWAGRDAGGVFVFTSSGGVFEADDGEMVDEYSKVADTPRAQRLIQAEEACLQPGGAVLRLAGLYTLERGAHNFWLTSGKDVAGRADGIINLLHYDDAAGACMAAIHVCAPQGIYLISDGNPLTRKEICESAFKSKMYQGLELPKFLGTETDPRGKIYNGSRTNQALKWKPRYSSFDEFMSQQSQ